jgi:hypothetical protein
MTVGHASNTSVFFFKKKLELHNHLVPSTYGFF